MHLSKITVLILWILIPSFFSNAQSKETIIEYFDNDWKTVADPKSAAFYRSVEKTETNYIVRDYYISGTVQMVAECREISPKIVHEGKTTLYYEGGVVKEESVYADNKHVGLLKTYYRSGKPRLEEFYKDDKPTYIHFWSEDGEELLPNGKGIVKPGEESKYDNYTIVKDSMGVASYSVSETDTLFTKCEQMPEYVGGLEAMMRYIGSVVRYPKIARKTGVEGTVFVGFLVRKSGEVADCKVIKGVSNECDEEALKAVRGMKAWKPGLQDAKPVSVRFVLPIKFRF
jgi:periplasmic protein TonB